MKITEFEESKFPQVGIIEDEPEELYHAVNDEADGWTIGNSMLKDFHESPENFERKYIKGEIKDEPSDYKRMGSLVHAALLQPDVFAERCKPMPSLWPWRSKSDKLANVMALAEATGIPYLDGIEAKSKEDILAHFGTAMDRLYSPEEYDRITATVERIRRHSIWQHPPFATNMRELTVRTPVQKTGMAFQCRLDLCGGNEKALAVLDIKTCEDITRFPRTYRQLRYYRQPVFYQKVLRIMGIRLTEWHWGVAETNPPYRVKVFTEPLDAKGTWFGVGLKEIRADLDALREMLDSGRFVTPGLDDMEKLPGPSWELERDVTPGRFW